MNVLETFASLLHCCEGVVAAWMGGCSAALFAAFVRGYMALAARRMEMQERVGAG